MANVIQLAWSDIIDPYRVPTETDGTRFVIPNSDGVTSTVINGTDFTYLPGGTPDGGTITSIELVLIADETVLQRVTGVTTTMADIGAFVGEITALRAMIAPAWFDVINQDAAGSPVLFDETMIVYENTDLTYTIVQGSGLLVEGGELSGTIDNVLHVAADSSVLPDSIYGLTGVTLAEGGSAMFDAVASIQTYRLCGAGDNTFARLDTGVVVGDTTYFVDYVDTPGSDTILGPVPYTFADYTLAPGPVLANLVTQTVVTGGETDTYTTTALIGVMGSDFDDTLTGNGSDNNLSGGQGSDTINGGSGDDLIMGGGGDDSMIGGPGRDTVSYEYALGAVAVTLAVQNTTQDTGGAGVNYLWGFESLTGSQYGDTLAGSSGDNLIVGLDGDDVISGNGGNDLLDGGDGSDEIYGGTGNDMLIGGAGGDYLSGDQGIDTVDYSQATGPVIADLLNKTAGEDWFISIENVIGSAFDDLIIGTGVANMIEGGDGADTISGLSGNDCLLGMAGSDTISGGGGDDILVGDADADVLSGGTGNDSLLGGSADDTLRGNAGADQVQGDGGRDYLYGGADADLFVYFLDTDSTVALAGRDVIRDFEQGIDRIDLSTIGTFDFVDTGPFSGQGPEVRYAQFATVSRVSVDVDGNGTADMSIDITGSFALTADDFILGPVIM